MTKQEQIDEPLRDLIEIIHFTENVSAKIHGLLNEAGISTLRTQATISPLKHINTIVKLLLRQLRKDIVISNVIPAKAGIQRCGGEADSGSAAGMTYHI
ncbi:MAG: hypothetical protein HOC20_07760 [Chloroflexi bacterium]|jgi:hypothetical protein|nr:hypothetical protein [Chloroflexota bacterium]